MKKYLLGSLIKKVVSSVFLFLVFYPAGAQWVQSNGPTGGIVYDLITANGNLFAGTVDGGLFRSTNNGNNWNAINTGSGLIDNHVWSLGFDGTTLFAGTATNGVFLSTDNGNTWSRPVTGLRSGQVNSVAVSFFLPTMESIGQQ